MSARVRKAIVYLALVAAVIYGWYNLLGPGSRSEVPPAAATVQMPVAAATAAESATIRPESLLPEDKVRQPWGRDPFRKPQKQRKQPARDTWTLTGIVYSPEFPVAYINRKAAREGDTIDNARIVKIEKAAVTLEYQGNRFTITVPRG